MRNLGNRLAAKLIEISGKQKLLILILLPCLVFGWWVKNDFIYDDFIVIKDETTSFSPKGISAVFGERHYPFLPYYRPVTRLTFVAQKALHGDNSAAGYHLVNVLLASGLGVSTYLFLNLPFWKLTKPWPFLGALFIAVHPVTSSSVYPAASGRETLLPVILAILALYFYLSEKRMAYIWFLVFFTLALFSKEQIVVLPLILGLSEIIKNPRIGKNLNKSAKRLLPAFIITGIYLYVRWQIFKGEELEWANQAKMVFATPVYMLSQWLWPSIELRYEPMKINTWFSPVKIMFSFGMFATAVWLGRVWKKSQIRKALFWWLAAIISLLPTANIIKQDAYFSERYILLAGVFMVGFFGMAWSKLKDGRKNLLSGVFALFILIMAVVSWQRGKYFENNLVFAGQWSRTSPDYYLPYFNLGRSYEELHDYKKAIEAYEKSAELDSLFAPNYLNLGTIALRQGNLVEAEANFIVYKSINPQSSMADYHLGLIRLYSEDFSEARDSFEEALSKEQFPEGFNNLGIAYEMMGEFELARTNYLNALELDPDFEAARNNLEMLGETE